MIEKKNRKKGYYEPDRSGNTSAFPVTVFAGNILYNGLHWHDHIEMILCLRGHTKIRLEGEEYVLFPGNFLTIFGGCSHEIYDGSEGGLQIICAIREDSFQSMDTHRIVCSFLTKQEENPMTKEKTVSRTEDAVGKDNCGEDNWHESNCREIDAARIRFLLGHMAAIQILPLKTTEYKQESDQSQRTDPGQESDRGQSLNQKQETDQKQAPDKKQREERKAFELSQSPLTGEENLYLYYSWQYELLSILSRYKVETGEKEKKNSTMVSDLVRYIHEHSQEPLSAAVLAGKMHVSQPTVYRIFQEQVGMHLGDYITAVRLEAACRRLQTGDEKVIDIAYSCGFTGLSNFYRVFQKEIRMTPAEYRRKQQKQPRSFMMSEPDIMKLNRFVRFPELGLPREALLEI